MTAIIERGGLNIYYTVVIKPLYYVYFGMISLLLKTTLNGTIKSGLVVSKRQIAFGHKLSK